MEAVPVLTANRHVHSGTTCSSANYDNILRQGKVEDGAKKGTEGLLLYTSVLHPFAYATYNYLADQYKYSLYSYFQAHKTTITNPTMKPITLSLTLLHASTTIASTAETPPKPTLTNALSTGSGCPSGTLHYYFYTGTADPNGTYRLTTELDAFTPYTGPATRPADRSKNCMFTATLSVPPEWAIRVNEKGTDVKGYMSNSDRGYTLTFRAQYVIDEAMDSLKVCIWCEFGMMGTHGV